MFSARIATNAMSFAENQPAELLNLSDNYLALLRKVWFMPEHISSPRGQKVREDLFYRFCTPIDQELKITTKSVERNAKLERYFARELELYKSGTLSAEEFGKIGKIWKSIANTDGTINSNYGYLAFHAKEAGSDKYALGTMDTHWNWCLESFRRDLDTRQAVVHFSRPRHLFIGNKDQVCALSIQFFVRDNILHAAWTSRSNDCVFGTSFDSLWALWLCRKMRDDLAEKSIVSAGLGTLSYMAHSLHIYERDRDLVLDMLGESRPASSITP